MYIEFAGSKGLIKIKCYSWNPEEIWKYWLENKIYFRGEKNKRVYSLLREGKEENLNLLASKHTAYTITKVKRALERELKKGNTPVFATRQLSIALWYAFQYSAYDEREVEKKLGFKPYPHIIALVSDKVVIEHTYTNVYAVDNEVLINLENVKFAYLLDKIPSFRRWSRFLDLLTYLNELIDKFNKLTKKNLVPISPIQFFSPPRYGAKVPIWLKILNRNELNKAINKALIFDTIDLYKKVIYKFWLYLVAYGLEDYLFKTYKVGLFKVLPEDNKVVIYIEKRILPYHKEKIQELSKFKTFLNVPVEIKML